MSHTPDHREDIRSAIRAWIRDDVRFAGKLAILPYENPLIEKIAKVIEEAKKKEQDTAG